MIVNNQLDITPSTTTTIFSLVGSFGGPLHYNDNFSEVGSFGESNPGPSNPKAETLSTTPSTDGWHPVLMLATAEAFIKDGVS